MTALRAIMRHVGRPHLNYHTGEPLPFASKDQNALTPSRATEALGEMMILDHPFDIQIFDGYRVKLSRNLKRRLVVKIRALASNLLIFPQKSRTKWQKRHETTSLHDIGTGTRFATTRWRGEIKLLFYSFSLTETHVF
jgi:hypothetical protein